ncbi:MAG: RNA pseudouridine synthase [Treponema sp.]|nr:RNA pseudouridine synthase [Treponema sp.]
MNTIINIKNRILFQNAACIIVNKLKGEAVEGARDGVADLRLGLKGLFDTETVEAVHRLDVPVTGCALFALNQNALVFLNSAFAGKNKNSVEKHYWAVVEKPPFDLPESGEAVHWIETNPRKNKSFAYNESAPGRKKASLRYRVAGQGRNYLFLEVQLLSGRHHQIRAQFSAMGLYIKGDLKYGAKRSEKGGGIRLHARGLCFPDPLNPGEKVCVTADVPDADALWGGFFTIASGDRPV